MMGCKDAITSRAGSSPANSTRYRPLRTRFRRIAEEAIGCAGANDVEIAVVEALTNLVKHGYPDEPGEIEIAVCSETDEVIVDIFDIGNTIPRPLLARAGPERFEFDPDDIEGLVEGGLGLSLIHLTMDFVEYTTQAERNWMHLVRRKRH